MNSWQTKSLMGLLTVSLTSLPLFAQGGSKKVAEGNKLFAEEKYDEANTRYRDALIENPESPIIQFNIGGVEYKKRNFEEALKAYEKSVSSDDILMQSRAYYNIGNTLYQLKKLPESIQFYKKALELNPNDDDAKYNLEYVRAKLKDNADKKNQGQDQQQKQDPIKPSEYAKELLKQAQALVAERKYLDAKTLLEDGLKKDETVEAFRDFMTRLDEVIEIQGQI